MELELAFVSMQFVTLYVHITEDMNFFTLLMMDLDGS